MPGIDSLAETAATSPGCWVQIIGNFLSEIRGYLTHLGERLPNNSERSEVLIRFNWDFGGGGGGGGHGGGGPWTLLD